MGSIVSVPMDPNEELSKGPSVLPKLGLARTTRE